MITDIKIFRHELFGEIRTTTNEKGVTFFVGNDVAKALGYAKPQNAIAAHVDVEDKTTAPIQGTGSNYKSQAIIINESGLYALVLSSKLPQAKVFKHWVTAEVLPQIRQTGGYIPTRNPRTGEALTEGEVIAVANRIMARTIASTNLPADGCLTASEVAQSLGIEVKMLNSFLVDKGVLYWNGGRYKLTAKYADSGLAQDRAFHYYALDGEKKQRKYLVWTAEGVDFIREMIRG